MVEHYLDRLAKTIDENWDQPALADFYLSEDGTAQDTSRGNHYTYGEMYEEILRVCDIFQTLGLQKGDHIAICGANSAHWAIAYLAIAAYQGVAVTIFHGQSLDDIAHQIDFSDTKSLFTDVYLWNGLKDLSIPQVEHVISLDNWQILRGEEISITNYQLPITNRNCHFSTGEPDNLAMICFTSGSTGVSKGVMLSYRNLSVNIDFLYKELKYFCRKTTISFLPMAHIYGIYNEILRPLCLGTQIKILRELVGLDILLQCYQIIHPVYAVVVPKLIEGMIEKSRVLGIEPAKLIISTLGGAVDEISIGGAELKETTEKLLIQNNIPIAIGYGMTECGPLIAVATARNNTLRMRSAGKVLNTLTARIAPNGEILVKGENVMLGYYKDPEATARKIDQDGWLHTGDKGHLDEDGYLYVEGRLEQDMIVLPNGENIHPEDIERKINVLPEVSESIVLARDGKLVAIVVSSLIENRESKIESDALRRHVLRTVNPELPLYSQLYDVEITDKPLQRTEKQTIKRYLYR